MINWELEVVRKVHNINPKLISTKDKLKEFKKILDKNNAIC